MSKKAFDKIATGLTEAIAVARGEAEPVRLFIPAEIDVKAIRKRCRMSQDDFAYQYGFTVDQIKAWEQGRSRPLGGVRVYLMLIDENPVLVLKALRDMAKRRKKAA
jgi:putative transcriptional regulator